jgi:hypothetical protein
VSTSESDIERADAVIRLVNEDHASDVVYVKGSGAMGQQPVPDTLAASAYDFLRAIPLRVNYQVLSGAGATDESVTISFGTQGDLQVVRDVKWKDNIARSLYLAVGQTTMR